MRVQLKNIICTTDFSDLSYYSVSYGIALAREFKAKLYLCHVIDLSSSVIYGETTFALEIQNDNLEDYAYSKMKMLMQDKGVDWEPIVSTGRAADEIARIAGEREIDMVITATRGRSGLKRLVLGSVTEHLMRLSPCPLLAVRGKEKGSRPSFDQDIKFNRILVGCDFSKDSILAYQYGLSLAQEFQADIHLAHVIAPPIYKDLPRSINETREKLRQDLRVELKERLESMVPVEAHNWCTPKTVLLAGQPHEEISKYAVVQDMDLVVLGVRGHSLVESLFVGSTTDRVVRQIPCPVLSVRADGKVLD
ncbi:universal stress protein [Thermodesulfobacteriota bacterium]